MYNYLIKINFLLTRNYIVKKLNIVFLHRVRFGYLLIK